MSDKESNYVGRLAPSPTGLLHLGHAATFWMAAERARAASGALLLRIEDLDEQRSRREFTEAIFEDLKWLGITWSEPVMFQSERLAAYREAFERLVREGWVYPCRCSRKDLAAMLHAPHETGAAVANVDDEGVYPGTCRPKDVSAREIELGVNYRFRVADGEAIEFEDASAGAQKFTAGVEFGDFLVWRRDGIPSYQLACVVDDAATGTTEVVRGRDLLLSTARQILLQRALEMKTPAYCHTQLLTDENGVRLAKRHDALALRTLRESGVSAAEVVESFVGRSHI